MSPDLSVNDAKESTQKMARTLAQLLPPVMVDTVDQDPEGVLIRCGGDRDYQWTGMTRVVLSADATYDGEAVTNDIAGEYRDSSNYQARLDETSDGEPRVQIFNETGEDYLIARSVDKKTVEIVSFSPCFVLPDGMSPSQKY